MCYISKKIERETGLLQEFSEALMDIMNLQEGAMVCSISQQKSLFKGLSYSIYLIIRYTSIANNKSKYLFHPYYRASILHPPSYLIIPLNTMR